MTGHEQRFDGEQMNLVSKRGVAQGLGRGSCVLPVSKADLSSRHGPTEDIPGCNGKLNGTRTSPRIPTRMGSGHLLDLFMKDCHSSVDGVGSKDGNEQSVVFSHD